LSIISSYIFYVIVVHIKTIQDKEHIKSYISRKVKNIVGDYLAQIAEFKKIANIQSTNLFLEESELLLAFKLINPNNDAPLIINSLGNYANWIQYMHFHKQRTQTFIQKLFVNMPFLDSKLVSILVEIDDCSHFNVLDSLLNMKLNNIDMTAFASQFYNYSILCKKLDEYYSKKLEL
jgi:hypothetical protein